MLMEARILVTKTRQWVTFSFLKLKFNIKVLEMGVYNWYLSALCCTFM